MDCDIWPGVLTDDKDDLMIENYPVKENKPSGWWNIDQTTGYF